MGYSLSPIELGWAKTVSRHWPVTEASAECYFTNRGRWTRKAVSAEGYNGQDKVLFHLKGGDFVVVEKRLDNGGAA